MRTALFLVAALAVTAWAIPPCVEPNTDENYVRVTSVDHSFGPSYLGTYFNFERSQIGLPSGSTWYENGQQRRGGAVIRNTRVVLWSDRNGGSTGDSHGRLDSGASSGQWHVGDVFHFKCQPIKCDTARLVVSSVDHSSGLVGTYFNFNYQDIGMQNPNLEWYRIGRQIRNGAQIATPRVILWAHTSGGSTGNGHGRLNPGAASGQWKVGDAFEIGCGESFVAAPQGDCAEPNTSVNTLTVTTVDHAFGNHYIGQYFNFDRNEIGLPAHVTWYRSGEQVRGGSVIRTPTVVLWGDKNGGSSGNSHGRLNPGASPGQWQVGDQFRYGCAPLPTTAPPPETDTPTPGVPPTPEPPTPTPPTPVPPPTPSPDECVGSCLDYACPEGESITVTVRGGFADNLYGSGFYSTDSHVGAAAVHAGILATGEEKRVTVRCAGEKPSFVGSVQNLVQSGDYDNAYPAFYFVGDPSLANIVDDTPAPETLPPAAEPCYNEPCLLTKCKIQGQEKEMIVTGSTGGAVYGSDIYTDDSPLAAAAVHAGAVQVGQRATVKVLCTGAQASYASTERNGVTSIAWGAYQYSYAFDLENPPAPLPTAAADTCTTCLSGKCSGGGTHIVTVTGANGFRIWGTDTFTDDSHLGVAAVHAGLIDVGVTATLTATCTGGQSAFTGSIQNKIESLGYGPYGGSFTLAPQGPPPAALQCIQRCMHNQCTVPGSTRRITVVGAATGDVWGVDAYTDDSDVQVAAVHMGLVAIGATATLTAKCAGPRDSWAGSERNGVTTAAYNQYWGYSFTLSS